MESEQQVAVTSNKTLRMFMPKKKNSEAEDGKKRKKNPSANIRNAESDGK